MNFDIDLINGMTGGRIGQFDVACPICGPEKRSSANRVRKVLRIWRLDEGFATFHCARCGEKGHTRDDSRPPPDPVKLSKARAEAAEREEKSTLERLGKARWLWSTRLPIAGTVAETYLRDARGYGRHLPIPATLGFLPGRADFPPAMIAAFGLPAEPEPGRLAITDHAVAGVHITRLAPDGSGKAGTERDKIMIGRSLGSPIVLAPVNDLFGLAIAEGIEDALSVHEATGLGAWAAGSASRLPALAEAIPAYQFKRKIGNLLVPSSDDPWTIECVTVMVDDDEDGRRYSARLAELVTARGIEATLILLPQKARGIAA